MKNKNLRNLIIIMVGLLLVIFVGIIFSSKDSKAIASNKNRVITILDNEGNEIYSTTEKLNSSLDSEIIISDNGVADSIISQVINDVQVNMGYSREEAIDLLNGENYKIYSTINMKVQEQLDKSFNDRSTFTSTKKSEFNQSAMVIMDYEGNVIAVATGNNSDNTKNRASTELIKVGSTIKPVAIYAPAIDKDIVNFSTIINDVPGSTFYNGQSIAWPTNYDNRYESNVTITDALKKSKNTVAVEVGRMVGEDESFSFLRDKLGYSTLVESGIHDDDKQLSALALGYFAEGVTLDTLVASYSMFGNGGYYGGKKYYTDLKDNDGNIILSNNTKKVEVISEESATIMNRLLFNNITEEDSIIKNIKIDGVEILGKTGTVGNDNGDNVSQLFVGMTPDYITGIWVGYDDNRAITREGYKAPTEIWQSIMNNMEFNNHNFKLSNNVYKFDYCSDSGLLKSDNCKNIKIGYYKESSVPVTCNSCK